EIPPKSGIYAWYYRHTFYNHDIETLVQALKAMEGAPEEARAARVLDFLQTFLFNIFIEDPYNVSISGPLKPTYEGPVPHVSSITPHLVKRIAEDPARLWKLQEVLEDAVPEFASPIYIGLSTNLRKRIRRHRSLMQRYKEADGRALGDEIIAEEDRKDHSFA